MPKLTNLGIIEHNPWQIAAKDRTFGDELLTGDYWLIHAEQYALNADRLNNVTSVGLWLDTDDNVELYRDAIEQSTVVAVYFPVFSDGRSFSNARLLRERLRFQGELLAIGAFMQDQLFYLRRCGIDSFLIDDADSAKIESMKISLADFSEVYQSSCDQPLPLFRRRAN